MFFSAVTFLIISSLLQIMPTAYGDDIDNKISDNVTYWCDDAALKDLAYQVDVLRLNMELNNVKFQKELTTLNAALLEDIKKLLKENQQQQQQKPTGDDDAGVINTPTQQCVNQSNVLPTSCVEALASGGENGLYRIFLPGSGLEPFFVYCMKDPNNGPAWTIVQRRQDGSVDFYRSWDEYKHGFGNMEGEFFIGLDKLYAITQAQLQELWIQMDDFDNQTRYAKYDTFAIGGEITKYALNVLGTYHGDAGDNLHGHQAHKFTTKDADHDIWDGNCAVEYTGAWWYTKCHSSNLNGQYLRGEYDKKLYAKGIVWQSWHGHYYSLKYVHMAVRPART